MTASVLSLCVLLSTAATPLQTALVQVGPNPAPEGVIARSVQQRRAVVIFEGLSLHLIHTAKAAQPELRVWQKPGSVIVRVLSKDSDVFAFAFAQTTPIPDIAAAPALGEHVQRLRQAGYTEIVLLGYSAGGLIARQFVEDNPTAGVTKVIQVCAPNDGSAVAKLQAGILSPQKKFVQSMTAKSRSQFLEERKEKRIPDGIEFVCVVGNQLLIGDGLVSTRSQWPDDLQAQGIPAVVINTDHWEAMRGEYEANAIARLVRDRQPRWDAAQVAAMRKRIWH